MVGANERTLTLASYVDNHFTVLGFTSSNKNNPVCCVIILAGNELKANHILGIQPWVDVDGDAREICRNSQGLEKYYTCGPKCTHM